MKCLGVIDEESKGRNSITEMSGSASVISEVSMSSKGRISVCVDPEVLRLATLGEEIDAKHGERKTFLCCGFCCDIRRACIIIDCIYFVFVVGALVTQGIIGWNPFIVEETFTFDDDAYGSEDTLFDTTQMLKAADWQLSIGILMSIVSFFGALKFRPYLVLGMAIWLCIDAILFCVWFNWISAVAVGIYS